MKDLLNFIITSLVTKPKAVLIDEQSEAGNVSLILTVDPTDMGLIIGKGGQTIRAIRKLLTVRAIAENVRVNLQLSEPAGSEPTTEEEAIKEALIKAETEEKTEAETAPKVEEETQE